MLRAFLLDEIWTLNFYCKNSLITFVVLYNLIDGNQLTVVLYYIKMLSNLKVIKSSKSNTLIKIFTSFWFVNNKVFHSLDIWYFCMVKSIIYNLRVRIYRNTGANVYNNFIYTYTLMTRSAESFIVSKLIFKNSFLKCLYLTYRSRYSLPSLQHDL